MPSPPVPKGLSPGSADLWAVLTKRHHFESRELFVFEKALRWWDKSDAWLLASETATGRDQARLIKLSMDASTCGLRYWRSLKFSDAAPARVGRPSGHNWSAPRKAAYLQAG